MRALLGFAPRTPPTTSFMPPPPPRALLWSFPLPTESEAYDISLNKLEKLLADRTKYYENADVTVDLRGYGKDEPNGAPTAGAYTDTALHALQQGKLICRGRFWC